MSDKIFSVPVREKIIQMLIDISMENMMEDYEKDSLEDLFRFGFKGYEHYSDEDLYGAVCGSYYWSQCEDDADYMNADELYLYKAVESEYEIYKMLKNKEAV
jgi:hypothetical protein